MKACVKFLKLYRFFPMGKLLENLHTKSLIAQRIVVDHMRSHNLEAHTLPNHNWVMSKKQVRINVLVKKKRLK